jgi:contactin associated protein-like 2
MSKEKTGMIAHPRNRCSSGSPSRDTQAVVRYNIHKNTNKVCDTDCPIPILCFTGFLNSMNNSSQSVLQPSFQGCMQLIQVDDQLVNLYDVAQRKPGSFANVSIDMCAIIDR